MRALHVIVTSMVVGVIGLSAMAQDEKPTRRPGAPDAAGQQPPGTGRGAQRPPQPTAEQMKSAWELEAKGVSKELGLADDNTAKTVTSYSEARESYRTAMEKARREAIEKSRGGDGAGAGDGGGDAQGGGGGRGGRGAAAGEMMKIMNEVRKAESEKLQASLGKFLSADQVTKAMIPLGTFDPRWDSMVNSIIGFKLDDAKTFESLKPIQTYVVALSNMRDSTDRDAMMAANREARDHLVDSMKKILNDEQMTKFQRSIGGGMGMRGEGGPGGPGGGGRGGAGAGGAGGGGDKP